MSNATYQLNACGCVTNLSSERSSNGAIDLSGTLVVDDELNFDPETQSIVCAVDASAKSG
ncbi:hypothetical protein [Pseudobacteriovorax antillogorgiicola]|uniref:Uncharacterized protein n=1 Tax=Pseudobacteriovorax antillogorgiicola TaxID=1513793 RepID=A0A1Y6CVR7_9BACT|nr:hypothetical protein [Pseudobacteriovorax antillogorgiicola]TCS42720.1 hypothetical protein EDD56_1417 [Pseudobacteriovorax antillogorgiicola]SMF82444.1 hypothetical protein SAMN06296036_14112 [Pseudobacteriovorax antillogorgiicola]